MFKNPLKYQQGGAAPSQQEQQVLAAFIQWLPKRVKEFQGMQPEQIAQALDGMSKTPEGKKQLQQLMMQFQQEMQGGSQAFRQGGKIHDFICKHAKGGALKGCGCKQEGGSIRPGFEYIGENVLQDRYNPNFFEVISNGYRVNGQDVAVPTRSGAYRMGIDKDNPGAWDNGQRVYTQNQFDNIKNFYENVLPNSNRVQGPKEKLAGMECGGKVAKASDGSDGIPQARNAKAARRAASKNTVSVGNSGRAKNRKIGAATDKFGGQHLYEDSVIDGSWSDVYVDVPHPGDTIVTQSFPVAGGNDTATRTYPMGSDEYESVMSRMRPAFRMFFPQYKCGGNIKKKESSKVIKGQNGFLNLWQSAYDSKFGKGLRNFMFGTDSDLSNEEYVKKHGYSKPIMGMPPAVKISYIPEGVYGSTRMAEQAAKAAKEAAKFKHVSPLDGGRLGHTIKDVSGIHLKNDGGKVEKAQEGMKQQRRILDTNNDIEHTWTRTIMPQDTTLTYGDGTYIQSWNSRRLPNGNLDRTTTVSYPDGELLEGPQEWSRSGNIQWKRQNQVFDRMLPQRDTLIIDNDAPPARKKGGIVK